MATIDKKSLEHLAKLGRIELDPAQEDKLVSDLGSILGHFDELKNLESRPPKMLQGKKVELREDAATLPHHFTAQEKIIAAFPEHENGYLKVPPIFE